MKDIIISELETLSKKEMIEKNTFKVRAYQKVIKQLNELDKIESWDDLEDICGIGKKIHSKIDEIFKTGKLNSAERARSNYNLHIFDELMKIYGIGASKAKELVDDYLVTSIDDLKVKLEKDSSILNNVQKIGLKHYDDINLKIPRKEMKQHETFLLETLSELDKDIMITIVGSYRRNAKESSDIDVLVTLNRKTTLKERTELMCHIIQTLKETSYIKNSLSLGDKKYMGIVKLKRKRHVRRMDILITSQEEYPYAMLYFTGSKELNIIMRQNALDKGFHLNEYSLYDNKNNKLILKNEKDIFNKLGYEYIPPENRTNSNQIKLFNMNL